VPVDTLVAAVAGAASTSPVAHRVGVHVVSVLGVRSPGIAWSDPVWFASAGGGDGSAALDVTLVPGAGGQAVPGMAWALTGVSSGVWPPQGGWGARLRRGGSRTGVLRCPPPPSPSPLPLPTPPPLSVRVVF
jgi:hypothetical protein